MTWLSRATNFVGDTVAGAADVASFGLIDSGGNAGLFAPFEQLQNKVGDKISGAFGMDKSPQTKTEEAIAAARAATEPDRVKAAEKEAKTDSYLSSLLAYSKERDTKQDALGETVYNRNLGLARGEDQRRLGLTKEMMDAATYTPGQIDREVGRASTDVSRAFSKARAITQRSNARMGISPTSAAWGASGRKMELDQAAAEAGAVNGVRRGLEMDQRANQQSVRQISLGMAPLELGVGDPRIGMPSSYINGINTAVNTSSHQTDVANQIAQQNNNNYLSGIQNESARRISLFSDLAGAGITGASFGLTGGM